MRFTASLVGLLLASVLVAAEPKVHRDLPYAEPKNEWQTLDVFAQSDLGRTVGRSVKPRRQRSSR